MSRRQLIWLTGLGALALWIVLVVIDLQLQDTGGGGIIGFELAGNEERAAEIKADWGESGRDDARLSLWLDFPFLILYGAFYALAVLATGDMFARRGRPRWARPAPLLAFAGAAAAVCDAIENVNLLVVLGGGGDAPALLAALFASLKFALTTLVVLYLLAGLVSRLRRGGDAPAPAA